MDLLSHLTQQGARADRDDWAHDAACTSIGPDIWFDADEDRDARQLALGGCAVCPVVRQCLQHALSIGATHGVWGMTTVAQRRGIARHLEAGVDLVTAVQRYQEQVAAGRQRTADAVRERHARARLAAAKRAVVAA